MRGVAHAARDRGPGTRPVRAAYRRARRDGATGIVVISLSAALSATMQSAELAARSVADLVPVTVVDSRNCTLGLGMIVADCARLARSGASLDAVAGRAA